MGHPHPARALQVALLYQIYPNSQLDSRGITQHFSLGDSLRDLGQDSIDGAEVLKANAGRVRSERPITVILRTRTRGGLRGGIYMQRFVRSIAQTFV